MSRGGCRTHLPPRGPSRGLSCAGLFRWAWVGIRPPLLASQPAWLRSRAGEGHRCPLKSQAEPRWDQPRGQPALTSDPPGSTAANAGAPEKLLEAPPRLTPQADSGAPFAPTDPSAGRGHLGARDTALRGATLRPVAAPRCSSLGKGRPQPPPPAPGLRVSPLPAGGRADPEPRLQAPLPRGRRPRPFTTAGAPGAPASRPSPRRGPRPRTSPRARPLPGLVRPLPARPRESDPPGAPARRPSPSVGARRLSPPPAAGPSDGPVTARRADASGRPFNPERPSEPTPPHRRRRQYAARPLGGGAGGSGEAVAAV
ncbi:basic proline-rich protein-like isoform X2 [Meles meles]|uniref:basic proline-rich protein-like isoform X2 n=1 Tax=Meles meles TaxID=9662 RepID=UPI001E69A78A|nr:basic proline-rich protein-like isoform X2 [Meles meles]